MKLDPTVVVAVVAFLGSLLSIILTNRYAARSARAAQEAAQRELAAKVDSEAFKRARENYDAAIAEQERRITRLNHEIDENRAEYRADATECKRRLARLQADLRALREWSLPLLRAARAAGIPHPDPPIWLDQYSEGDEGAV
jgi:hypothetical protein